MRVSAHLLRTVNSFIPIVMSVNANALAVQPMSYQSARGKRVYKTCHHVERRTTCDTRTRPPPLSLWPTLCVVVPHTHRQHPPKFWPNLKHLERAVVFPHFARACLLLACCLLVKPVKSTLDTKEGNKTKTGSTSSVTLVGEGTSSRGLQQQMRYALESG